MLYIDIKILYIYYFYIVWSQQPLTAARSWQLRSEKMREVMVQEIDAQVSVLMKKREKLQRSLDRDEQDPAASWNQWFKGQFGNRYKLLGIFFRRQDDRINSLVKEATDAMADHDDKMEPINGKKRKGTSEGSSKQ